MKYVIKRIPLNLIGEKMYLMLHNILNPINMTLLFLLLSQTKYIENIHQLKTCIYLQPKDIES